MRREKNWIVTIRPRLHQSHTATNIPSLFLPVANVTMAAEIAEAAERIVAAG